MRDEQKLKVMARLQNRISEWDENLMSQLVDDAEEWVLEYTNRTVLPDSLLGVVSDLATISLNRLGTEGDASRSEAGESYSFNDAPSHIFKILDKRRLARCGGHAHETSTSEYL